MIEDITGEGDVKVVRGEEHTVEPRLHNNAFSRAQLLKGNILKSQNHFGFSYVKKLKIPLVNGDL